MGQTPTPHRPLSTHPHSPRLSLIVQKCSPSSLQHRTRYLGPPVRFCADPSCFLQASPTRDSDAGASRRPRRVGCQPRQGAVLPPPRPSTGLPLSARTPPMTGSSLCPSSRLAEPLPAPAARRLRGGPQPPLPSHLCSQPAPTLCSLLRAEAQTPIGRGLGLGVPAPLPLAPRASGTEPFALLFPREPRGGRGSLPRGRPRRLHPLSGLRAPARILRPFCQLPGRGAPCQAPCLSPLEQLVARAAQLSLQQAAVGRGGSPSLVGQGSRSPGEQAGPTLQPDRPTGAASLPPCLPASLPDRGSSLYFSKPRVLLCDMVMRGAASPA